MKKIYILAGLIMLFGLFLVLPASATNLPDITVTPSNAYSGLLVNDTINFTTVTQINVASSTEIAITFSSEFDLTNAATSTISIDGVDYSDITGFSKAGQKITLSFTASTTITTAPIVLIVYDVRNPYSGGSFTLGVEVSDTVGGLLDSGTSASFIIVMSGRVVKELYTISFNLSPSDAGTIPQSGSYTEGASVGVNATPKPGYLFLFWEENGAKISDQSFYSFTVNKNRNLVARFEAVKEAEEPLLVEEKPVTEIKTAEELKSIIAELQQKIISLLNQVIQLLQSELAGR